MVELPIGTQPLVLRGHVVDQLRLLPAKSVQCIVTSPPYYRQRSYQTPPQTWSDGWVGELGQEPTPEQYALHLARDVGRELHRVLRDDGVYWLNIGDKYADDGNLIGVPWLVTFALKAEGWVWRSSNVWAKAGGAKPEPARNRTVVSHEEVLQFTKVRGGYFYDPEAVRTPYADATIREVGENYKGVALKEYGEHGAEDPSEVKRSVIESLDPNRGSLLRSVWWVVKASYREAHYAVFPPAIPKTCILASTSEKGSCPSCGASWNRILRNDRGFTDGVCNGCGGPKSKHMADTGKSLLAAHPEIGKFSYNTTAEDGCVPCSNYVTLGWEPTCSCPASSPIPSLVLDPFAGSGTTLIVARSLGRRSIGIELSGTSVEIIENRDEVSQPSMSEVW